MRGCVVETLLGSGAIGPSQNAPDTWTAHVITAAISALDKIVD